MLHRRSTVSADRPATLPSAYFPAPPAGTFAFSSSNELSFIWSALTDGGMPSHLEGALLLARLVHQPLEARISPERRQERVARR